MEPEQKYRIAPSGFTPEQWKIFNEDGIIFILSCGVIRTRITTPNRPHQISHSSLNATQALKQMKARIWNTSSCIAANGRQCLKDLLPPRDRYYYENVIPQRYALSPNAGCANGTQYHGANFAYLVIRRYHERYAHPSATIRRIHRCGHLDIC